jgi:hypothetical protein
MLLRGCDVGGVCLGLHWDGMGCSCVWGGGGDDDDDGAHDQGWLVLCCVRDEISLQMGALSLASYIHTLPVLYLRCCPYSTSPSLVHVS